MPGSDVVIFVDGLTVKQEQSAKSKNLVIQSERCGVEHWEMAVGKESEEQWTKNSLVRLEAELAEETKDQSQEPVVAWKFELSVSEDES
mmetsp:Transcript_17068/g.26376  ORF Transcript_17068/g.26376 Transcript_17068/m.26376 type:complete len:89 (-) Transcript_17068:10834-11100(-)